MTLRKWKALPVVSQGGLFSVGIGGTLLNINTQCFKGFTRVNHIVKTEILHSHLDLNGHDDPSDGLF